MPSTSTTPTKKHTSRRASLVRERRITLDWTLLYGVAQTGHPFLWDAVLYMRFRWH